MNGDDAVVSVLLLAGTVLAMPLLAGGSERLGAPPQVAYTVFGILLGAVGRATGILDADVLAGLQIFATVGVVVLLFRVGLRSSVEKLRRSLRGASLVWVGDVAVSGAVGFAAAHLLLGYPPVPSLFVATALSATSVGVSTVVWSETRMLGTAPGALLTDVAELDDLSAVFAVALLSGLLHELSRGGGTASVAEVLPDFARLLVALVGLATVTVVFSLWFERRCSRFFAGLAPHWGPLFLAVGAALLTAATAEILGYSYAIGAVFAGLAFSRDPAEHRIDRAFEPFYRFFAPFFFAGIGLAVDPAAIAGALPAGVVLLTAAVLGKFVGAGLPAAALVGGTGGVLIGISMIPRAEIALVVMQRGVAAGPSVVPPELYGGVVLVSIVTCLAAPAVLRRLLTGGAVPRPRPEVPARNGGAGERGGGES